MAAFLGLCVLSPVVASASCLSAGNAPAAVASVNRRLELILKDGRILRLAGFVPVRPTPDDPDFGETARAALARMVAHRIEVLPLAGRTDRWGRIPAFVDLPPGGGKPPQSLTALLLAEGYGRFMPEPAVRACAADFLAAEAMARAARRGLWRDPYYAILAATDSKAFAERAATDVIVEGRVVDVDVRPRRTYLLFGPRGSGAFAVTILQRNVKIFERAGWDFRALIGHKLRVRGLLDLRFGPQIEVSDADSIALIPESADGSGLPVEAKAADPSKGLDESPH